MKYGFTLIELLVVITIIVVLLALLTPALDKAIYQAELALCASNQKTMSTGVLTYAFENNRRYPKREAIDNGESGTIRKSGQQDGVPNDDRPMLRKYINLNAGLNDPLTGELDFETLDDDTVAISSFQLWFGMQYGSEKGMFRIGDRWAWTDNFSGEPKVNRFDLLVGDKDTVSDLGADVWGSHPDRGPRAWMFNVVLQNKKEDDLLGVEKYARAQWRYNETAADFVRGTLDMNYAHDDGSVDRLNDLLANNASNPDAEPRLAPAPHQQGATFWPDIRTYVPPEN